MKKKNNRLTMVQTIFFNLYFTSPGNFFFFLVNFGEVNLKRNNNERNAYNLYQ